MTRPYRLAFPIRHSDVERLLALKGITGLGPIDLSKKLLVSLLRLLVSDESLKTWRKAWKKSGAKSKAKAKK